MTGRMDYRCGLGVGLAVASLALGGPAVGAVSPITAITASPAPASPTTAVSAATTLTSVTSGGQTYDQLAAPTVTEWTENGVYWWTDGETDPGSDLNALSNLQLTTGHAGTNAIGGTLFFSNPDTLNTFVLLEVGGDNTINFELIDADGESLGLTLSVDDQDHGSTVFTAEAPNFPNGNTSSADFALGGVTFTLDDFTGTGTTDGFAGFNITTTSGDVALVAGVVPEPASAALVLAGLVCMTGARRARSVWS